MDFVVISEAIYTQVVVLRNELENLVVEPSTSSVNHLSTEDVRLGE